MHINFSGSGRQDVLLLHYFGGSGPYWRAMTDHLPKDRFRFIVPDLPGFGQSAGYLPQSSVMEKAARLKALLESQGTGNCIIAGHSMGGKIGMALASLVPDRVSALLLLAPSPPSPEPISFTDRQALRDIHGDAPKLRKHLASIVTARLSESTIEALVQANCEAAQPAWNAWLDNGSREDISAQVDGLRMPVRILHGSDDALITASLLEATVRRHFSMATIRTLEGCGHLVPAEKPQIVANELMLLAGSLC